MGSKITTIFFIFVCATGAWWVLGGSITSRTSSQDAVLKEKIAGLWGSEQRQEAPTVTYRQEYVERVEVQRGKEKVVETHVLSKSLPASLDKSTVRVNLNLDHRKKGLLWYATYAVTFDATYRLTNHTNEPHDYALHFRFPSDRAVYDSFGIWIAGVEAPQLVPEEGTVAPAVQLAKGESRDIRIRYTSQGMGNWWYAFGNSISQARDFNLTMATDFADINFPDNSMSPVTRERTADGWVLGWTYSNLLSGTQIGMEMPQKLNPGPFVSRVSFFAPVSLFLFFFLLFMITVIREIKLHPLNYFFLAAAFFSFHLLLAYLVDHIDVYLAMVIASGTSIFLVISYMRLVVGVRFALVEVGISQFVYLILFSYAFFLEGYTGLTITVCCILTLAVLMNATGRIDWERKLRREPGLAVPPTPLR